MLQPPNPILFPQGDLSSKGMDDIIEMNDYGHSQWVN